MDAAKQIKEYEHSLNSQRARLDSRLSELSGRCNKAEAEFGDVRTKVFKDTADIDAELKTVRLASTSLAQGVLRALQLIGLLGLGDPDPHLLQMHEGRDFLSRSHVGLEISDLLLWERQGRPLTTRVQDRWREFEGHGVGHGVHSILALVEKIDFKAARASAVSCSNQSGDKQLPTLPSTAASFGTQSPLNLSQSVMGMPGLSALGFSSASLLEGQASPFSGLCLDVNLGDSGSLHLGGSGPLTVGSNRAWQTSTYEERLVGRMASPEAKLLLLSGSVPERVVPSTPEVIEREFVADVLRPRPRNVPPIGGASSVAGR